VFREKTFPTLTTSWGPWELGIASTFCKAWWSEPKNPKHYQTKVLKFFSNPISTLNRATHPSLYIWSLHEYHDMVTLVTWLSFAIIIVLPIKVLLFFLEVLVLGLGFFSGWWCLWVRLGSPKIYLFSKASLFCSVLFLFSHVEIPPNHGSSCLCSWVIFEKLYMS
jgi:hypothetical protein